MTERPFHDQFETLEQQRHANLLGIWMFLATEVLFFGGLFAGFAIYRVVHGPAFAEAAGHLNLTLGTINTVLLVTSGLTMSLVDPAMQRRRRDLTLWLMGLTALLGIAFLVIKGMEYHEEYVHGLVPLAGFEFHFEGAEPRHARMFFDFYFALTGLHALHMAIGIVAIAIMAAQVWRWRDPARLEGRTRITGLYWAFVDVVWLFVFPTLYLLRT